MVENATTADLSALVGTFRRAKQDIPRVTQDVLERTAKEIQTEMQRLAPVKTGALRNGIRIITEPKRVTIGAISIPYAAYVEYGTGTRGEFGRSKPGKTRKTVMIRSGNRWVVVKATGQKAQPYARPAAAKVLGSIGVPFAQAGADLLKKKER